jgi:hypothetical protein
MKLAAFALLLIAQLVLKSDSAAQAKQVHHYIYYAGAPENMRNDSLFLTTKAAEGAQIAYRWRQLEPEKGEYDFSMIRDDLAFLSSKGKKLWIQFQDVTFMPTLIPVPRYLVRESEYNGGADKQYRTEGDSDTVAVHEGWASRRWDPKVQERFYKLLDALGKEFDGRITGINFAESSVGFGSSGRYFPKGYSYDVYRDAIIANMKALKRAFPKSVTVQYANFMPGEWRPVEDKGYLRAVYDAAKTLRVGVGGPDVMPFRPGHVKGAHPLIRDASTVVPVAMAVQDGNFEEKNRETGKLITLPELMRYATDSLNVDYLFWGTQQPFYSSDVIPFLRSVKH